MKIKRTLILLKIVTLSFAFILFYSCNGKHVKTGMLIVTEAPGYFKNQDNINGGSWRYFPRSRIIAFNPDKPVSPKVLTEDFYSASFPEISYDGRYMLFSAQQNKDESWQIWEMELNSLNYRKITSNKENCIDPAYLPGERLVFSKLTLNDTVKTAHCLYTCKLDGSDIRQITFSPHANFATTVLKDGRLLTISRQLFPYKRDPVLMVMRPDGTKADMFYQSEEGNKLIGSVCETADGKILFIESNKGNRLGGNVISINYNRPLHTRTNLTTGIDGEFSCILPLQTDKYLVSFRKSDSEHFALYMLIPGKKSLEQAVFSDPEYSVIDIVLAEAYERPRKMPSEVDLQVKTGLLLCQDINFLNPQLSDNLSDTRKASKIEVLGIDTTYGVVEVEKDGSFQLKVMANIPFRIRTLDEKGNVVSSPCSWLWLRPNERRGCAGCHEDPELAPDNRVSLAIRKSPVIIPVHITEVREKIVELE